MPSEKLSHPLVSSYFKAVTVNAIRVAIAKANDLSADHNNNTMSEACLMLLEGLRDELQYTGEPVTQDEPAIDQFDVGMDEGDEEPLYDNRVEALEAMDLPYTAKELDALKKGKEIIAPIYNGLNEDEIIFLGLPATAEECSDDFTKSELINFLLTGVKE